MADDFLQLPTDGTGKKVDTEKLTVGANEVHRERHRIAGAEPEELVEVRSATPFANSHGLVTRPIPSMEIAGVGVGAAADAEASGNGSVIAILKFLRSLLQGAGIIQIKSVSTPVSTAVDVTMTTSLLLAGRAGRKNLIIQASDANQGDVYIGDSSVSVIGAKEGIAFQPGLGIPMPDYAGPIYGRTSTGGARLRFLEYF
jgi:hypothetical protein